MDHLTALKVFRHVAELNSFAEAGRRVGLSPAAISKNIGELEAYLAVRLINRTTRRMALTEAGTLYYSQVSRILDDLEEADRSLGPLQQVPTGILRVSAPMTVTLTCLSSALPRFLTLHPGLSLELNLEDRVVDIVKEGFDVAIRGSNKLDDSSLIARKLMAMPHVLCGAPAYFEASGVPQTPEDLSRHNCVQFTPLGNADTWEFFKSDRSARITVNGQYKVNSSLAVRDALLAGFGLSLIPYPYVKDDLAQGRLGAVLEDWSTVDASIYAIYPSRLYLTSKVRAFLDFLVDELTEK
ncbi:LysR family transcriptional regulator [Devosia sp. A449]